MRRPSVVRRLPDQRDGVRWKVWLCKSKRFDSSTMEMCDFLEHRKRHNFLKIKKATHTRSGAK